MPEPTLEATFKILQILKTNPEKTSSQIAKIARLNRGRTKIALDYLSEIGLVEADRLDSKNLKNRPHFSTFAYTPDTGIWLYYLTTKGDKCRTHLQKAKRLLEHH